jgi:hypothetical protein
MGEAEEGSALMAANPQPAPEPHHLKLEECTLDEVIRLVGANVLRRKQSGHACFYLADQSELYRYRSDPKLEQSRGLPVVICRVCGQISIAITNNHLRRHDLSRETYGDANHWPDAPLISPADHHIRSASGKKRWTPERRGQQKKQMEDCWAALTPQERAEWIQNSTNALQSQDVRGKISVGTKKGLAAPEVREKISESSKRAWDGNQKRREAASKLATEILCKPEIVAQARAAHDTPETSKAISEGNINSWANDDERKQRTSEQFKKLWAERKAEQRRARCEKLLSGKRAWMQTAGKYLLDHPDALNDEIAEHIDSIGLLRKDGKRWVEAIRGHSVTNDFGDLRKLLGIPGGTFRRTKSVKSFVALT